MSKTDPSSILRVRLAWLGLAWLGLAWLGLAWLGLAWQQSGSRAQRYAPLFITIRPKENIKISKLMISLDSRSDS